MSIFDKERFAKNLREYYLENYGEKETDVWYEQPAVNVWVFGRDGKIITLKSHILTGEVTEQSEKGA
ncbi:MAG: hypothetical protein IJO92_03525 [Clostridia bacterium]|nr:hypothetical protein [Clostridia bacterium]